MPQFDSLLQQHVISGIFEAQKCHSVLECCFLYKSCIYMVLLFIWMHT